MLDLITGLEHARLSMMEARQSPPGVRADERGTWEGDAAALEAALRGNIEGEVRFDDGSRALYATDASNYRQVPIGVVVPKGIEDVVRTVEVAHRFGAPILARGGGTSLAGQCCNVGVVIDFSKYLRRVLEIDVEARWARVEPGIVLDVLRAAVAPHGLWFGPDPATHTHNTIGGMIGNNSCGMHAQFAGKTDANTLELEILTYDGIRLTVGATDDEQLERRCAEAGRSGEIYRELRALRDRYARSIRETFPDIPRRVSGYALDQLLPENGFNLARALVGTECTCVVVLSAKLKLIPNPAKRAICVLGFDDVYEAADRIPAVNALRPIAVEGMDDKLIEFMHLKHLEEGQRKLLPDGNGWLMVEFGDVEDQQKAIDDAHRCAEEFKAAAAGVRVVTDHAQQQELWSVREAALGASAKVPHHPDLHPGWEDSAVPPDKLGGYLRDLRALYDRYGYDAALYGHFGQGCIHCRVDFKLGDVDGVAAYHRFMVDASHLVHAYGGSLSGEHGDGQARGEFLPIMYGAETVAAFGAFKRIWDPGNRMNPGKVVDPYPSDTNLRLGPQYRPLEPETHFSFEIDDRGSFSYATNRCVGVGKCRRQDEKDTMCPSFRVTQEEKHSTRGRARLLFEMLEGAPLAGGWQSESVKDALDLCLSCKGCKGDGPVNVDMATYKAEFLAHYYEKRRRPIVAYAFGLMPWWAHLASKLPRTVNALLQAPLVGEIGKRLAGVAPQRRLPPFAERSFKDWWRARERRGDATKGRVVLWADTWNNYFHAQTAQHAVEVLEHAGYEVVVPAQTLCCGRPLYDYGMLGLAKVLLREIIDALRPEIEAGTPIVGLEPSCVSVFKDELLNLYPNDQDARRLSAQTVLLGDFLAADHTWTPPAVRHKVVLHGHCHQKAIIGMDGERAVLERAGCEIELLDDGCCGMAGAFGFEAGEHYDVSIACGELKYLPAVRAANDDTIVLADGFSCREQAMQTTDRQPLHLADVLWLALQPETAGAGETPERAAMPNVEAQVRRARGDAALAAAIATLLVFGALAWRLGRRGGPR